MIRHEMYEYIMVAGLNWFFPIKARPGEVILVNCVSIYNQSGANYAACYKAIKCHGRIFRVNSTAAINNGVVQRWEGDNFLINNDELGVAVTPNAAGETTQVTFQIIRVLDSDYDKIVGL
ncbi:unnamed protein product [marine sediment metagenome]|uniref:Uncharacterized protein n=1 Tax=marine sediment metagenome TaxID=412755 RepID=X1FHA3_9ZZZZ